MGKGKRKRSSYNQQASKKARYDEAEFKDDITEAEEEVTKNPINVRRSTRLAQKQRTTLDDKISQAKEKIKDKNTRKSIAQEKEVTLIEGEKVYTDDLEISERRLDSLARLLEGGSKNCTAIAFVNGKILIADNSIHGGTIIDGGKESIKIHLIRDVMNYYSQVAQGKEKSEFKKEREDIFKQICAIRVKGEEAGYIKLDKKEIKKIAIDVLYHRATWKKRSVNAIIGRYPKVMRPFVLDTYGLIDLLVEDFVKIERFLRSTKNKNSPLVAAFKEQNLKYASTNETFGLMRESYNMFKDANPGSVLLRVDSDKVHAEVKVLVFLLLTGVIDIRRNKGSGQSNRIYIGISKLCCRYCIHFILALNKVLNMNVITVEEGIEIEGQDQYNAKLREIESVRLAESTKNIQKDDDQQIIFIRGHHNLLPDNWEKSSVLYESENPYIEGNEEYNKYKGVDEEKKDVYIDKDLLTLIQNTFDPIYEEIKKGTKGRKKGPSKVVYQSDYSESSASPTPSNSPTSESDIILETYDVHLETAPILEKLLAEAKTGRLKPNDLIILEKIINEAKKSRTHEDFLKRGNQLDGGQLLILLRSMGLTAFTANEIRNIDDKPDMQNFISDIIKNYASQKEKYDSLENSKAKAEFEDENPTYIAIFKNESLNILFRKAVDGDYNNNPKKLEKFFKNERIKLFFEGRAQSKLEQSRKTQKQGDKKIIEEIKSKEGEIKSYIIVSEHLERYTTDQDAVVMAILSNEEFMERTKIGDKVQSIYIIANRGNHHWVTVKIDLLGVNQEGKREFDMEIIDPAGGEINNIECMGLEELKSRDKILCKRLERLPQSFKLRSYKYISTNQQSTDQEGILSTCGIRAVFNAWYLINQVIKSIDLWSISPTEKELRDTAFSIVSKQGMSDEIIGTMKDWFKLASALKSEAGDIARGDKKLERRDRKGEQTFRGL